MVKRSCKFDSTAFILKRQWQLLLIYNFLKGSLFFAIKV